MNLYELDISWATTANERRYLRWELIASDNVIGAFLTARDDVLAVLFSGNRHRFHEWARLLVADHLATSTAPTRTTNPKGALQ